MRREQTANLHDSSTVSHSNNGNNGELLHVYIAQIKCSVCFIDITCSFVYHFNSLFGASTTAASSALGTTQQTRDVEPVLFQCWASDDFAMPQVWEFQFGKSDTSQNDHAFHVSPYCESKWPTTISQFDPCWRKSDPTPEALGQLCASNGQRFASIINSHDRVPREKDTSS